MDFLFHEMSEKEKEDVKKQVNSIIDSFSKKLFTIRQRTEPLTSSSLTSQTKEKIDANIEREKFERDEEGNASEIKKEIMFENAPESNKDFIIAEKKKW
jgi:Asp-tRNA(Asn)/Glu-tRNA(Gln) amidotransferase C subunit